VFEIEETLTIDQPIERVWAFVMDESNDPLWQTTLTDVRRLTDGPLTVGSRVSESRRFLGRTIETVWEMAECEAPHVSSIASVKAPFAWEGTYTLAEDGDGTRFTIRLRGNPGGFFRIAEPLLQRFVRREIAGNLGNLNDVLEGGLDRVTDEAVRAVVRS
jgi:ligand-binding SRPBCC domain-containing protein